MIRINRMMCFVAGLFIIALFYFCNRLQFIIGAEKINGHLLAYEKVETPQEILVYPVVEFEYKGEAHSFHGRENSSLEFDKEIPLLIRDEDPSAPLIFTLKSFWLYPLFYALLPLVLWSAFSLSYIAKGEYVQIGLKYPFLRKQKVKGLDDKSPAGFLGKE